ncbi:unnamed protein product [Rotaria sp. Silwood2]|nr:unnamed protein product [Rotaria sp. Silwood2]
MPSKIILCILCGKKSRSARSKYTKICTSEREEKIREGYRRRHGKELNTSLLNQQVHVVCYKSLVFDLVPVSTITKTGRPRRIKNCSSQASNFSTALIDITNNVSSATSTSHFTNNKNNSLNTSFLFQNRTCGLNALTPIDICFDDENENSKLIEKMSKKKNFSSISFSTSNSIFTHQSVIDLSNQDISVTKIVDSDSTETTDEDLSINMEYQSSTYSSSYTPAKQNLTLSKSDDTTTASSSTTNEQLSPYTMHSMSPNDILDEVEDNNIQTSINIPSVETQSICSSTSTTSNETKLKLTTEKVSAVDVSGDDCPIVMDINDDNLCEIIIERKYIKKVRCRSKRIHAQNSTRSKYHFRRSKSRSQTAAPFPDASETNCLYSNGFDELCAWLLSIVRTGSLVSMGDIAEEYKLILNRRQERITNGMLRTTSIRSRLINKLGNILHFEKISNYDVNFLGNEIFRHKRSKQLLSITNRLGHTPSYNTMVRLHQDAAYNSRRKTDPFAILRQNKKSSQYLHDFAVKVADNFDLNPDTLYGNNSIHILNQIIVSTSENDEIPTIVAHILDDVLDEIVKSSGSVSFNAPQTIITISIDNSSFSYKMFTDTSLFLPLFAYALIKYSNDSTRIQNNCFSYIPPVLIPLMSGFFATYLPSELHPPHTVSYLTPINKDPSSELTAEICLDDTKSLLIDSQHQKEGILVVDENNYFETMYKSSTLRGILDVQHFNRSLRCCKLLYTALQILLLEAFISDTSSTTSTINDLQHLKKRMEQMPSEFVKYEISQKWFQSLLDDIRQTNISTSLHEWTTESAAKNSTYRLWSFVLRRLLEPLLELYMSIRTGNFSARNAALNRFAPIFFSTNHRNYSRLCAQHLVDLQTCSSYLFKRMSCAFAVTRSRRRFSSIALDQMIECTINKHGKSKGGISGLLNEEAINTWTDSFAFRALITSNLHEICGLETDDNSMEAHVECLQNRKISDDGDLSMIVKKLRKENIFTMVNVKCHKLQSGLIIHDDIISSITSLYERGEKALNTFIYERLITKVVPVDIPLKAMPLLKLALAGTYVPGSSYVKKKGSTSSQNIKNFDTLVKLADEEIRRTVIIAEQRNIKPLSLLFAHEFAPTSFALCDTSNVNFLNQQTKSKVIDFLYNMYPSSLSSSCPISTNESAIVIDGGSLFETKPQLHVQTIREYAIQLLEVNLASLFKTHNRIDVVFDSIESKTIKMFTKRYENDAEKCVYHLKGDDRLESPFSKFVHSNRASLAACVKECWMEPRLTKLLPKGRLLVVGGPDDSTIKLQNDSVPIPDYILESTQVEVATRLILHTNIISLDQQQNSVLIQSPDPDVVLLAIAFSSSIILDHLVVKLFNTHTKNNIYVDVKYISDDLRRQSIDPKVLLVLHVLSGCDTTSYIRNITKEKFFQRFFGNPLRYSSITNLIYVPPPQDAIDKAEELLINCYPFNLIPKSLNDLRGMMASVRIKDRSRKNIAASLPPSTMAFREHCLRCSRQLKIWLSSIESHSIPPAMSNNGYEYSYVIDRFKIKWSTLGDQSNDYRLATCGDCKGGCTRCKCYKNNLSCTFYCKCDHNICSNRHTYNVSIDQLNEQDSHQLQSTRASTEDDNERSIILNASQSNSINNKSIAESDFDVALNQSYENSQLECSNIDLSKPIKRALFSSIKHDHTYCLNDHVGMESPKRRRFSSVSLDSIDGQLIFQSPCAYSSPKHDKTIHPRTQTTFKTPLPPTTSTPRSTARFRKSYGKAKPRDRINHY